MFCINKFTFLNDKVLLNFILSLLLNYKATKKIFENYYPEADRIKQLEQLFK